LQHNVRYRSKEGDRRWQLGIDQGGGEQKTESKDEYWRDRLKDAGEIEPMHFKSEHPKG
jgi:hypothetical protein